MAKDITVVSVEHNQASHWRVTFSAPVVLPHKGHNFQPSEIWVACSDDDPFDYLNTDELGAFLWGLKIIEMQKEQAYG